MDTTGQPSDRLSSGVAQAVISNPILLTVLDPDVTHGNSKDSSESTSIADGGSNSSMHITDMFNDRPEHVSFLFRSK